jgi:rubrerythrin
MNDKELRGHHHYMEKMAKDRNKKLERILEAIKAVNQSQWGWLTWPKYQPTETETPYIFPGNTWEVPGWTYARTYTSSSGEKPQAPEQNVPRETSTKDWKYDPETGTALSDYTDTTHWICCPICAYDIAHIDHPTKCPGCGTRFPQKKEGKS